MSKATITDIARKLGISPSSVSKALSGTQKSGNTRISAETLRRVQEVAQEMNYRGNPGARAMRTRRFHNIGFFEYRRHATDYSFSEPILNGISEVAARFGQNIMLVRVPELADFPRALSEEGLDALIVASNAPVGAGFEEVIKSSGLPVIYLNDKRRTNAVYVNDVLSGRLMTTHLISRGFRRIAMLAPNASGNHYSTADRISGYLGIMREAALTPILKSFDRETWREETREWLSRPDKRPEAIFCESDHVAMFLQRILYDLRLHVPGDIALAGCDGDQLSLHSTVPLSTLEIPFHAMGVHAMELALECVNQKNKQPVPARVLDPKLIVRESSLNRANLDVLPQLSLHDESEPVPQL
ncbi:MAG: LacI family DNA-binding transcriptional regulator [Opitutaceae bacterium]|jgi:LacI family transcriptional regulator